MEEKYLQMTTVNNNNKYYHMIPESDTVWRAEYGRVGASPQVARYPASKFSSKYNEKLRKGYQDVTLLHTKPDPKKKASAFKEIADKSVRDVINYLLSKQKRAVADNYLLSTSDVTQNMIDEAERILDFLSQISVVYEFNQYLMKLFNVLPRAMTQVSYYLAKSPDDFEEILERERCLLDVLKSKVEQDNAVIDPDKTILEYYGIKMRACNNEEVDEVKGILDESKDLYYKAWRVEDEEKDKIFKEFCRERSIRKKLLLCHGSRTENWFSILTKGLLLRPNAVITGKLFGIGIYFAPKAKKSVGYTSLRSAYWTGGHSDYGFLAIMEVGYGTPHHVRKDASHYGSMTEETFMKKYPGKACLHAHTGANMGHSQLRNDEIIVYNNRQCRIKYLVELKAA